MDIFFGSVSDCSSILLLTVTDLIADGFKPVEDYPFQVVDEMVESDNQSKLERLQERMKGNATHVKQQRLKTKDESGQVGTVTAQDVQNDSEYLAQVPVGTPSQAMNLDFDTGSADL